MLTSNLIWEKIYKYLYLNIESNNNKKQSQWHIRTIKVDVRNKFVLLLKWHLNKNILRVFIVPMNWYKHRLGQKGTCRDRQGAAPARLRRQELRHWRGHLWIGVCRSTPGLEKAVTGNRRGSPGSYLANQGASATGYLGQEELMNSFPHRV